MTSKSPETESLFQAIESIASININPQWIPELADPSCMLRLVQLPNSPSNVLKANAPIELTMTSHHFDHVPIYQALSYTWACPYTLPKDIAAWNVLPSQLNVICNGHTVPVSRNLFQALKQMIALFPGAYFWIDALCINQTDEAEKTIHIQLMGEVYSSAANVVAWLGPPTKDIAALTQVHERFQTVADARPFEDAKVKDAVRSLVFFDASLDARNRLYREIWWLFMASWWKRKWTYQEHILAQDSLLLVYGRFAARCDDLQSIIELLPDPRMENDPLDATIKVRLRGAEMGRLRLARLVESAKTDPRPMIDYVIKWQGRISYIAVLMVFLTQTIFDKASLQQDEILSLLGACRVVCRRTGQPVEDEFLPIRGSYNEIASAVAIQAFLHLPMLNVLRFAGIKGSPSSQQILPSWLPEFRPPVNGLVSDQQYDASLLGALDEQAVLAGRRAISNLGSPFNGALSNALSLRALKVGTLLMTQQLGHNIAMPGHDGQPHTTNDVTKRNVQLDYHVIYHILGFCLSLPSSYAQNLGRDDHFWATLFYGSPLANLVSFRIWTTSVLYQTALERVKNKLYSVNVLEQFLIDVATQKRGLDEAPASSDPAATRAKLLSILGFDIAKDIQDLCARVAASPSTVSNAFTELNRQRLQSDLRDDWQQDLAYIAENRIGVTSQRCRPGDQVWILQGGEFPVILRPAAGDGNRFQLVGHMYVGGIMHGEFVRESLGQNLEKGWARVCII